MKTLLWIGLGLIAYSYLKNNGSIQQILQNMNLGANGNPNLSVTNSSPFWGAIPSASHAGPPGGSLSVRSSNGPSLGVVFQI